MWFDSYGFHDIYCRNKFMALVTAVSAGRQAITTMVEYSDTG